MYPVIELFLTLPLDIPGYTQEWRRFTLYFTIELALAIPQNNLLLPLYRKRWSLNLK